MIKLTDILKEIKVNNPFRWVNFKAQIDDEDDDYCVISLINEKDNNKNVWYGHIDKNKVNVEFENTEKIEMDALIDLLKKGNKKYEVKTIDDEFTYITFDKSLVDIVDSLDEIKVNNPNNYLSQARKMIKDAIENGDDLEDENSTWEYDIGVYNKKLYDFLINNDYNYENPILLELEGIKARFYYFKKRIIWEVIV